MSLDYLLNPFALWTAVDQAVSTNKSFFQNTITEPYKFESDKKGEVERGDMNKKAIMLKYH